MSKEKKDLQLGMNSSTASNRLVKDILFKFVIEAGFKCFHCNETLQRENFSIEHKEPWLDSKNPVGLFFDLDNIAFSHFSCNVSARRKEPAKCGTISGYNTGCRCVECKASHAKYHRENYLPERRSARYKRTGN